mgnify:CR=1 FL=1
MRFGPFVFHIGRGELRMGEDVIHLTDRERDMLRLLTATPGETANASARFVELQKLAQACAAQADTLAAAFESSDAGMRARALTAWERRLQRQGADGEVAACGNAG